MEQRESVSRVRVKDGCPQTRPFPVVIGGSGGSGTRAVAEILMRAGMHFGCDLNISNDDLSYSYLFKHTHRYMTAINKPFPEHQPIYALHQKLILRNGRLTARDWHLIWEAAKGHMRGNFYGIAWILQRWYKILRPCTVRAEKGWGWKEPHTMFFLHGIKDMYPDAKFILVVRDGRDMAYSRNTQQFREWGSAFQIDSSDKSPGNKFEFWYRANRQAWNTALELFERNCLMVRLEELCRTPESGVTSLLEFAGLDTNTTTRELWSIPKLPSSFGRHRLFDTGWVTSTVRDKLADFDYTD